MSRWVVLTIFFVSGAAALVYEVVWMRWLALIFGVSTYAVSTVLAAFMAGLAIGSYAFGRWVDGHARPLRAYAVLEAGIGAYALCVPWLFDMLRIVFIWLNQLDLSPLAFAACRGLLAALLLLPPAILMGGTLPILVRHFVRRRSDVGSGTGLLYFLNTAGATVGTLAAGFYLIEQWGLLGTTRLAVAVNLAVAVIAWLESRRSPPDAHAPPEPDAPKRFDVPIPAHAATQVLVCIGISGFAALAYEVLWTRALTRFLYNSTYAFTTMLATFLAGIALGSAAYSAWFSKPRNPLRRFALLQLCVGAGFLASSLLFRDLAGVSSLLTGSEVLTSFADSVGTMFLRAALILFLPTLFLGASLPLATDICTSSVDRVGQGLGRVYAVNTTGSILGSLASGFLMIPLLGMQQTLVILVCLNLLMAGAIGATGTTGRRRGLALAAAVAGVVGVTWIVPGNLFRGSFAGDAERLVFYKEGATDTVGVVEFGARRQRAIVYDDQRGTAGTHTVAWNFFLGHLPMLLHPGEPTRILHICFGVGNSLAAVARHDSVERIDNVELSPNAIEAAPYFWTNENVLQDERVRTVIQDGRTFVMSSEDEYDLILLEPPEIFTAGVINLYTREFYQDAARLLAPDGMLMQWLMVGQVPAEDEKMFFAAMSEAFPYVTAWQQLSAGPILLIGSKQPLRIDYQRLVERMSEPSIRADLEQIPIQDPEQLLSYLVLDPPGFAEFVEGVDPITEDRTVVDFSAPRFAGSGFGFGLEIWGQQTPVWRGSVDWLTRRGQHYASLRRPVLPYVHNFGDVSPETVEARIRAEQRRPTPPLPPPTRRAWTKQRE